jgi:CubicO group peptidase (beta-lactamase class C family)
MRRLVWFLVASSAAAQSGFDAARLESARANLARKNTRALYIVKDGKVVLEWYADGVAAATRQGEASLSKALVGGMSLLVAMNDGCIRPGDAAAKFIPAWRGDPRKSRIQVRHLATHTSGIEDAEGDVGHMELPGWKGAFWRREPDPFSVAVRDAAMLFDPGTGNQYSNPGMAALSYAITASLKDAPQKDVRSLLRERVMLPL